MCLLVTSVNILLQIFSCTSLYSWIGIHFFCLPCVFMLSVEQWTCGIHFAALSLIYTLHPVSLYETKMYHCIPEGVTTLTMSTFISLVSVVHPCMADTIY